MESFAPGQEAYVRVAEQTAVAKNARMKLAADGTFVSGGNNADTVAIALEALSANAANGGEQFVAVEVV